MFLFFINASAQVTIDSLAGRVNGVWWTNNNILNDTAAFTVEPGEITLRGTTAAEIKRAYPPTVGVFTTVTWRSLAPNPTTFDWRSLDSTLKIYSDSNLLIILMVWVGPDCPDWIYSIGVPPVFTDDPVRNKYPFYFYKNLSGDSLYKRHWYRMLDSVAEHVKTKYTGKFRKSIAIVQSAEGRTGDEGPYKGNYLPGTPDAYKISRSSAAWIAFRQAAWKHLDTLYRIGIPIPPTGNYTKQIHLLINSDPDDPEDGGWLKNNAPSVWRKTNTVGHGYQFNDETEKKELFRPLIDSVYKPLPSSDSVTYSRCRDEMDQYENDWQKIHRRQYNFYQAASALHFGFDIWPNTATGLLDTARYKKGFDFFTKYAGYKTPQTTPGGFCVLHTGLNAADTIKFPTVTYGSGTQAASDSAGMNRCRRIAAINQYALGGARQDDSVYAQGEAVNQLKARGLNDVGWNIYTGNYERYLTQIINATDESKNGWAYWRIGSNDTGTHYGRFAKGFRRGASPPRDSIFFKIDDSLFTGSGPISCTLHIAYYDTSTTPSTPVSWKILYDAQTSGTKKLQEIKNINTGKWIDLLIPINDGRFKHNGPRNADIVLVNVDANNEIFALVEIFKSQ